MNGHPIFTFRGSAIAGACALTLLAGVSMSVGQRTPAPALAPAPVDPAPVTLTPEEQANTRVYEVANKSVVNINTSTVEYDRVFGLPVEGQGSGSGSVIDRKGHILTNYHVVDGAQAIQVTLATGQTLPAKLIGADAEYDLAVLKVEAPADSLTPITMGRSDTLRVGQKAYAVGNPFGLEGTLTVGIVSSLNRSLPSRVGGRAMTAMIQTDAAMNPGNSGGPLLDSGARMIGMNVAIATKTGQNTGVGFAIPVDRLRRYVPELISQGHVVRPYHGIVTLMETQEGLKVARVSKGGPAERAGLRGFRVVEKLRREGNLLYKDVTEDRAYADYILAVDNRPTPSVSDFVAAMDAHQPGDQVELTILRQGVRESVVLTLGSA
ncbi:Periplasmic pH-dependent serine endoprotease DegQ precursor [Pirellulimonas nuda]|uniref:Periplasmic pH-dependent serine endoprotease DegQ n=1 Tax=Pirellulimonas nuda TaxID=2528009 RepID=A0A518DJ46_9BACT|nr:trypsin-like peptidase domain-containing protein [Pirellulimonas nuda]QDU91507.1 Periplasmic pH-dependent serine endoprotease DegQ precursor [Pirellulimonas nuda]